MIIQIIKHKKELVFCAVMENKEVATIDLFCTNDLPYSNTLEYVGKSFEIEDNCYYSNVFNAYLPSELKQV